MQMGGQAMVVTCKVTECSYNQQEMCCAPDIQVGDMHPQCDTFTTSGASQTTNSESHVGNCKVQDCTFNESMNCNAPGITVDHHMGHADCETYRRQ